MERGLEGGKKGKMTTSGLVRFYQNSSLELNSLSSLPFRWPLMSALFIHDLNFFGFFFLFLFLK